MTRADDLRAEAVRLVNGYILENLDPGLAEDEMEALLEAGDVVDMVLDLAYRRTRADLDEIGKAMREGVQKVWHGTGEESIAEVAVRTTQQAWWESWPATFYLHHSGEPEPEDPAEVRGARPFPDGDREHIAGPCWCGNPVHTVVHIGPAEDGAEITPLRQARLRHDMSDPDESVTP